MDLLSRLSNVVESLSEGDYFKFVNYILSNPLSPDEARYLVNNMPGHINHDKLCLIAGSYTICHAAPSIVEQIAKQNWIREFRRSAGKISDEKGMTKVSDPINNKVASGPDALYSNNLDNIMGVIASDVQSIDMEKLVEYNSEDNALIVVEYFPHLFNLNYDHKKHIRFTAKCGPLLDENSSERKFIFFLLVEMGRFDLVTIFRQQDANLYLALDAGKKLLEGDNGDISAIREKIRRDLELRE